MQNIRFIETYDFGKVVSALKGRGSDANTAEEAAEHLRIFMLLHALHPTKAFAAWKLMDDAWHEFILRTSDYEDFCEKAFGRFLHHDADAYGTEIFWNAWSETVDLAAFHYGLILDNGRVESVPATCMFLSAATCMVLTREPALAA